MHDDTHLPKFYTSVMTTTLSQESESETAKPS